VREPYQLGEDQNFRIATLADPDNNYFQLMSPMPEMAEQQRQTVGTASTG
jgi:hypothetical protein